MLLSNQTIFIKLLFWVMISVVFAGAVGCKNMPKPENTEQTIHTVKHMLNSGLEQNINVRDKVDFERNLNFIKRSRAALDLVEAFHDGKLKAGEACELVAEKIVEKSLDLDPVYLTKTIHDLCSGDTTPEGLLLMLNRDLSQLLIDMQKAEDAAKGGD